MCVALILLMNSFYKVYYWLFDLCEHALVSALILATVLIFFLPVFFSLKSVRSAIAIRPCLEGTTIRTRSLVQSLIPGKPSTILLCSCLDNRSLQFIRQSKCLFNQLYDPTNASDQIHDVSLTNRPALNPSSFISYETKIYKQCDDAYESYTNQ
uniref:G_PROTEIN_RECEP_F1_2 domain-containing protein n=1 Tax=Angiostrongylus cantonensis TaxID=6313 RepID=A0A0K0CYJ5_ANGCA